MTKTNNLAHLRTEQGLSQESLAAMLEVTRQTVSRWELGETSPSTEKLLQMSQIFGVSADYLMGSVLTESKTSAAVGTRRKSGPQKHEGWRRPTLIWVTIGLAIAAVIALISTAFFAGYDRGANNKAPDYPIHTDILQEEDIEGTVDIKPLFTPSTNVLDETDFEGTFDISRK